MIEAKGPGYAKLLQYSYFADRILPDRWTRQASRQVDASGGRGLDWFFAEGSAAEAAQKAFRKIPSLARVNILTIPAMK
jgi:hypothetical protein